MSKEVKGANIEQTVNDLNKKFGANTIYKYGDKTKVDVDVISSGCLTLDEAMGIYGLPRGRIVEIYGPESSGKTTLTLHAIAEAQKGGLKCAFIDVEHALDHAYATALGVNVDAMYFSQPDNAEIALEVVDALVRTEEFGLIVVDSVAALVPKVELDGDMGNANVGVVARLMSQACRKLTGIVSKSNTCVVFINQLRDKIGVMFGSPEVTTGGKALKFYASIRLDVRRRTAKKEKEDGETAIMGNRTEVKVVKNKLAPPFKVAEFDIIFGEGIDQAGCIIDVGVVKNILTKRGSHIDYKELKLGNGRSNAVQMLKDNPELMEEIRNEILSSSKSN